MRRSSVLCAVCFSIAAAVACGGSSSPPAVDVTGRWVGSVESNAGPPGYEPVFGTYTMTLDLVQSGSSVTGPMTTDVQLRGMAAGGVSGLRVDLRITVPPCGGPGPINQSGSLSLVGTISADGRTMSVQYEGTACEQADYGRGVLTRS
jgi:hypothetical protein